MDEGVLNLWGAVLQQAVADLRDSSEQVRNEAYEWLMTDGADLCETLGIASSGWVRSWAAQTGTVRVEENLVSEIESGLAELGIAA